MCLDLEGNLEEDNEDRILREEFELVAVKQKDKFSQKVVNA